MKKTCSQTTLVRTLEKRGKKNCRRQRSHKNLAHRIVWAELIRAHRDSMDNQGACVGVGSSSAYMLWLLTWCSCGTSNTKSLGYLWFLGCLCLFLGPFSFYRVAFPALVWAFVPSPVVTCSATRLMVCLGDIPGGLAPFWREMGEEQGL